MMRSMLLALLLAGAAPAHAYPDPWDDNVTVIERVRALFAAFETGDVAAMLRHVYPDGRVTALERRGDGASNVRQLSWAQFAERVPPGRALLERTTDPMIMVAGDFAIVWISFEVRVAGRIVNCGLDHFDLVRENGAWKIMNLTFSSQTTGCSAQRGR